MISKHPKLIFFQMSGCAKDWVVIHYNIHCIGIFLPYYAYASSKESVNIVLIKGLHGL